MTQTFRIDQEHSLQSAVKEMIGELNTHLLERSPPEYCFHLTADEMAGPKNTVFVARLAGGRAVAMGALRRHGNGLGEIKRMYTRVEARGMGIGMAILRRICELARAEGLTCLMLETGVDPAACALYERAGFVARGRFLDYPASNYSKYYELRLLEEVSPI